MIDKKFAKYIEHINIEEHKDFFFSIYPDINFGSLSEENIDYLKKSIYYIHTNLIELMNDISKIVTIDYAISIEQFESIKNKIKDIYYVYEYTRHTIIHLSFINTTAYENFFLLLNWVNQKKKIYGIPIKFKKYKFNLSDQILFYNNALINRGIYLEELLGEGSYAVVYSFIDPILNHKFALKILKEDQNESKNELRFNNELDTMVTLTNNHILKAYKNTDDVNYYIMDFCEYTLGNYLKHHKLTMSQKFSIIYQIIDGLSFIHNRRIYHRDLSLNNVLCKINEYCLGSERYNDLIIKISDFGLAKFEYNPISSTNSIIRGTFVDVELKDWNKYKAYNDYYALGKLIAYILEETFEPISKSFIYNIYVKLTGPISKRYLKLDYLIEDLKQLEIKLKK